MNHETLHDLIKASGLGLRAAAEKANIGRTSLWRWANGVSAPRHAQAAALARVLGVETKRVLDACSAPA